MNRQEQTILVTGATGNQGGAVARHLLADGWRLRALVRNPNTPAAQALAAQGITLVQGDLYDRASLDRALAGVYGVFSVQNFWLPDVGAEGEVRQGKALADAAKAAGVQHFVYSSVGGAERNTGIPHFESKWEIEQHIQALGLPATVFRPVFFMDNFNRSRANILGGSLYGIGLRLDRTLQMLAVDDVGAFVALALAHPQDYLGRAIELAGDELTEAQTAEVFSRVIGREVRHVPQSVANLGHEREIMTNWFNDAGYEADIQALRAIRPQLKTLEQYLRQSGWENAAPVTDAQRA